MDVPTARGLVNRLNAVRAFRIQCGQYSTGAFSKEFKPMLAQNLYRVGALADPRVTGQSGPKMLEGFIWGKLPVIRGAAWRAPLLALPIADASTRRA